MFSDWVPTEYIGRAPLAGQETGIVMVTELQTKWHGCLSGFGLAAVFGYTVHGTYSSLNLVIWRADKRSTIR
ncbi:hypothetical protein NA56DRAFT_647081 [Hyaloscypha hepaticicola]|uniref:Uncharacterized protein n=1 Tax=Hyaloscypha hepaticicola TaxID=2082293 RepID=A0A2J6Q0H0_9HELO|nr:hypothetical protein NA56DRAFT_647081 [Hyaloscypha hepaticicola]